MPLTNEQKEEIRFETEHRCDIYTDGEWFQDKIREALCELLFPDIETCDGECHIDLLEMLKKAIHE
ncbi:MAG: hypothetical protein CMD96_01640 [Gammaproteobacteria bacterium]|jgi:hypothetical protein|nr:hypothetical protein [Gammaproteobacteria bacterium]